MVAGQFDPEAFLNQTTDGANSTAYVPCPEGEYPAIVTKVEARPWQGKKDPTKSGVSLTLTWEIDDNDVKRDLDRDSVTVRQDIMLDLLASGGIDTGKGKNVSLGRTRDAVGLNGDGPFNFKMFEGKVAKVKVVHEIYNEAPQAKVSAVARLA
jgi:hypothetical protein